MVSFFFLRDNNTEIFFTIHLIKEVSMIVDKQKLFQRIGSNINYYRYHSNNDKIVNDKGFVTIEKLAEEIGSSPNMLYNLTAKNVKQGLSIAFLDKIAQALNVDLYCFLLKKPLKNPPKY